MELNSYLVYLNSWLAAHNSCFIFPQTRINRFRKNCEFKPMYLEEHHQNKKSRNKLFCNIFIKAIFKTIKLDFTIGNIWIISKLTWCNGFQLIIFVCSFIALILLVVSLASVDVLMSNETLINFSFYRNISIDSFQFENRNRYRITINYTIKPVVQHLYVSSLNSSLPL